MFNNGEDDMEVEVTEEYKKVYDCIFNKGRKVQDEHYISYQKIADETGIATNTVGSILKIMIDNKYIKKKNHFSSSGGAKANSYRKTGVLLVLKPEPEKIEKPKSKVKVKKKFKFKR